MGIVDADWTEDVLTGFSRTRLGTATLVRPNDQPDAPKSAVLHVHGYNDYFFQTHLANAFVDSGRVFYAVDLARAGRSLLAGDIPHYMADVAEQGDGIDAAVRAIADLHPGLPIVVHGHSTGGLTSAIWAADRGHPALAGVILDSPLFGKRYGPLQRAGSHALPVLSTLRPRGVVSHGPSVYATHQHVSGGGRWDFDVTWKRPHGLPARVAWANAVRVAEARIARGLGLSVPVLVARSDSSGPDVASNPLLDSQDTVLDVAHIALMAPLLGERVTELVVPGGVHELSLSRDEPRAYYFQGVFEWLDSVAA
ncbi:serine aminopeptidase domain-containing protein [Demequina lutea]|uniref:Alpha-beta hydrolase superfamily lysophospholipase n=1 Tax=Demequina lutea TaxID=431489 RepID=A0A7Y9ZCF7_9MICO|nr:alpha/beta hydrolase [Demequina lutea]NYI41440.1 alpha-beta hydrolase superfamily lysophospholipase [Demequina lutea]